MIAKFYPSQDLFDCVEGDGAVNHYAVKFVMIKFPLYVVKIHTKSLKRNKSRNRTFLWKRLGV